MPERGIDTTSTTGTGAAGGDDRAGWPFDLVAPPGIEWGMQLAVRYDKLRPATHLEVCAAAARAVVRLLADPRSVDGGPWAPYVRRWRRGRIRKLVRRARGIRWEEVQTLPGVTVAEGPGGRAQVRAFVPAPVRPLPPALDKLQVSGTQFPSRVPGDGTVDDAVDDDLRHDLRHDSREGHPDDAADAPTDPPPVVTIALTPYAALSTGKAAAQAGHAAQLAWEHLRRSDPAMARRWLADDARVAVIVPDERGWRRASGAPVRVIDAGLTEVEGPTESARAWW